MDWEASSQRSFAAELSKHAADIELVATGLEKQAEALVDYAGQLARIKDRQIVLEQKRRSARDAVAMSSLQLMLTTSADTDLTSGDGADNGSKRRALVAAQSAKSDADAALRAVESEWEQLISDRQTIDATCASSLRGREVLGTLSSVDYTSVASKGPEALLAMLGSLSETDLRILLKEHPQLQNALDGTDPKSVSAWWTHLAQDQRDALIAGASAVVGGLNGVPALDRVAANRINAADRLAVVERKLARLEKLARDAGRDPGDDGAIQSLRSQREYLEDATSEPPQVQLYLYQPELDRIVEMVGTPSTTTNKVVTYSPGTFGDLDGFYSGGTQQISRWLQRNDQDGLVAFVYKDGRYPQNFLTEANDQAYAARSGRQLADFEAGLNQDLLLVDAQSIAIGHSWGAANVTSAEAAGASWDTVVSLSGAGAPQTWVQNPDTHYADFSYNDILQMAQHVPGNYVWDGRNPRDIGFEHSDYYDAPSSWKSALGEATGGLPFIAAAGLDSHNLTATSESANMKLLDDMRKYIYDAGTR
ncbi:hypothetical protein [Curtobacterium luteum]|uniref:hypothetical protein n=1 Tax=Curtobacterium luteum TaxID=33881 RepID=UPI00380BACD2